jgi:cation:H+ antiporter
MVGVWIAVLLAAGAVLVRAAVVLTSAGDELAERSGLGRMVFGMFFLAIATSLPEVFTDISAVVAGAPDLAVGDLFGSSMANMAILAIVDLSARRVAWPAVELGHARVASIAIALTCIPVLSLVAGEAPAIGWVGIDTVLVVVVYLAALRWIHRSPVSPRAPAAPPPDVVVGAEGGDATMRPAIVRFAAAAVVVAVSAPFVAVSAKEIASIAGIAESFVGVALLAVVTSLPELISSITAVRIGAHDLAVGNLFGSNAANMTVLFIADLSSTKGPILSLVDPQQAVAGLAAILLMALALGTIVHGTETRIRRLEPDAVFLLGVYVASMVLVWGATA